MVKEQIQIPYKSKVAYELVFLEAIKDMRKQRVNDPDKGYINSTLALELILLPNELKDVEAYMLDPSPHEKEIEDIEKKVSDVVDEELREKIYVNALKKISWPLYCKKLDALYESGDIDDQDFNGTADKSDLIILKYKGLVQKIIEVLKKNDWLIKGADMIVGGGGHGLDQDED